MKKYLLVWLVTFAACSSDELVLPEAKPLSATDEQLSKIYKMTEGPYSVVSINNIVINAGEDKTLVIGMGNEHRDDRITRHAVNRPFGVARRDAEDIIQTHQVAPAE